MRIVLCVKQVPAQENVGMDAESKCILRTESKAMLNPYDLYAAETALRLREKIGGEVIALSMGPESANAALREVLSLGADKAVLLCDRAFAGSDTWATSYALAKAIKKIGAVDLVVCGQQSTDGDTAHVGPSLAAHLDWRQAAFVTCAETISSQVITVLRRRETTRELCEIKLPAVLTVEQGAYAPRVPALRDVLRGFDAEIPVWSAADIGADAHKVGLEASPTRVARLSTPPPRAKEPLRLGGDAKETAASLLRVLRTCGLSEMTKEG
jgi:electron transfer flavoprotein beta subunit